MFEPRGGRGMYVAELVLAVVSGGVGFVLADGIDRWLATYDPAASQRPTDKFTSDGAGTLANTLNVSSMPSWQRFAAGTAMTVVPAFASAYVDHPLARSSIEGFSIGSGVKLFSLLWNNVLMPLLAPKDTSTASLQKSVVARLYPAEIAAAINLAQKQQAVSSGGGSGALSGPPTDAQAAPHAGVGAPPADVGPFALGGSPSYPDAAQALRRQAGISGDSSYPDAAQALRREAGLRGDSTYPNAAEALRRQAGVSQPPAYQPGPGSTPGPGPQAGPGECACLGDDNPFLGFIGDEVEKDVLYTNGKAA